MAAHRGEVVCEITTAKALDAAMKKEVDGAVAGFLPLVKKPATAPSTSFFIAASRAFAVVISQTTSPLCAAMMVLKAPATAPTKLNLPFSAIAKKRFFDNSFIFNESQAALRPSTLSPFFTEGSAKKSANLASFFKVASKVFKSFSTAGRAFCLVAAEYKAVA